jgi:hypothetical protein
MSASLSKALEYSFKLNPDQRKVLSLFDGESQVHFKEGWWTLKELGWSEAKALKTVRSLYGIVGFSEYPWMVRKPTGVVRTSLILGYSIPSQNKEAVEKAFTNGGIFTKSFQESDINVLRALYERDSTLNQGKTRAWSPRFHQTEVAQLAQVSQLAARERLERLTGLLAVSSLQQITAVSDDKLIYSYGSRWFIPRSRLADVKQVIS